MNKVSCFIKQESAITSMSRVCSRYISVVFRFLVTFFVLLWIGSAVLPNCSAHRSICVVLLRLMTSNYVVRLEEADQVNLEPDGSTTEALAGEMDIETHSELEAHEGLLMRSSDPGELTGSYASSDIQRCVEGDGTWVTWQQTDPARLMELVRRASDALASRENEAASDSEEGTTTQEWRRKASQRRVEGANAGWVSYSSYMEDFFASDGPDLSIADFIHRSSSEINVCSIQRCISMVMVADINSYLSYESVRRWCAVSTSIAGAMSWTTVLHLEYSRILHFTVLHPPVTYMRFPKLKIVNCQFQSIREDTCILFALSNLPSSCVSISLSTPAIDFAILNGSLRRYIQRRNLDQVQITVTRGVIRKGQFAYMDPGNEELFVLLSNYLAYISEAVLQIGSATIDRQAVVRRLQLLD